MKTKLLLLALSLLLIIFIPNFADAVDPVSAIGAIAHGTMAQIDGEIAGEKYYSNLSSKDQDCVVYYRTMEQDPAAVLAVGNKLENCSKTIIKEYQMIKINATNHSPHFTEFVGDLTSGIIGNIKWFNKLKIIPSPFLNTGTKEMGKRVAGDVAESATRSYIQNESVIEGTKNQMIKEYTDPIKVSEKIADAGIAGIGSGLSDDFRKGAKGTNRALLEYGKIKEIHEDASIIKIFAELPNSYSSSEKPSNNPIIDPTKQENNSKENLEARWNAEKLIQDSKNKNSNVAYLFNNFPKGKIIKRKQGNTTYYYYYELPNNSNKRFLNRPYIKIVEKKQGNTTYYYYELPNGSNEKSSIKENLDARWNAETLIQDSKDRNNNTTDLLNNFPGGKIVEEKRGNTTYYHYELPSSDKKSSNKENLDARWNAKTLIQDSKDRNNNTTDLLNNFPGGKIVEEKRGNTTYYYYELPSSDKKSSTNPNSESTKKVINSGSNNSSSRSSSSSKNDSPKNSSNTNNTSSQNSPSKSTTTSSSNVTQASSTNIQNISNAAKSGNINNLSTTDKAILASRL